jgi:hypothetical protein
MHFYYYVMCSFVSLSILTVMFVPFCVFCFIVLFCVLYNRWFRVVLMVYVRR